MAAYMLLVLLLSGSVANAVLFARRISLADTGLVFVYEQTWLTKMVGSAVECAAYVNELTGIPIKANRPSVFTYVESNGSCTPGRTPTFEIFPSAILDQGDVDIYEIVGKPLASTNLDTWFYAMLNEELSTYWGHPNFINAWPSTNVPDWTTNIAYNILSPVISYGGQYAMTFSSNAGLYYNTPVLATTKYLTFLAWYKPVATITGSYGVVSYYNSPSTSRWIALVVYNGYVRANLYVSGATSLTPQANAQTVTNGGPWVYLGFSLDLNVGKVTFWQNGSNAGTVPVSMADQGGLLNQLRIAGNSGGHAIASLEIYTQALNQSQVQAAMTKSISGRTTTPQLPN